MSKVVQKVEVSTKFPTKFWHFPVFLFNAGFFAPHKRTDGPVYAHPHPWEGARSDLKFLINKNPVYSFLDLHHSLPGVVVLRSLAELSIRLSPFFSVWNVRKYKSKNPRLGVDPPSHSSYILSRVSNTTAVDSWPKRLFYENGEKLGGKTFSLKTCLEHSDPFSIL